MSLITLQLLLIQYGARVFTLLQENKWMGMEREAIDVGNARGKTTESTCLFQWWIKKCITLRILKKHTIKPHLWNSTLVQKLQLSTSAYKLPDCSDGARNLSLLQTELASACPPRSKATAELADNKPNASIQKDPEISVFKTQMTMGMFYFEGGFHVLFCY